MKPDMYENNEEGILCVYKNPKWLVCIKNWKPDNDINCSMENSDFCDLSEEEIAWIQEKASRLLA